MGLRKSICNGKKCVNEDDYFLAGVVICIWVSVVWFIRCSVKKEVQW